MVMSVISVLLISLLAAIQVVNSRRRRTLQAVAALLPQFVVSAGAVALLTCYPSLTVRRSFFCQEPNIRYLGLEVMSRLARLEGNETAKKHQATVLMSLKVCNVIVPKCLGMTVLMPLKVCVCAYLYMSWDDGAHVPQGTGVCLHVLDVIRSLPLI